jgi:hypothetical protein
MAARNVKISLWTLAGLGVLGLVEALVAYYLKAVAVNSNASHGILREKHNPSQAQAVKNLSANSVVQRVLTHGTNQSRGR